jgi:hypothetical protein
MCSHLLLVQQERAAHVVAHHRHAARRRSGQAALGRVHMHLDRLHLHLLLLLLHHHRRLPPATTSGVALAGEGKGDGSSISCRSSVAPADLQVCRCDLRVDGCGKVPTPGRGSAQGEAQLPQRKDV